MVTGLLKNDDLLLKLTPHEQTLSAYLEDFSLKTESFLEKLYKVKDTVQQIKNKICELQ